jgi:hypothetical protein
VKGYSRDYVSPDEGIIRKKKVKIKRERIGYKLGRD